MDTSIFVEALKTTVVVIFAVSLVIVVTQVVWWVFEKALSFVDSKRAKIVVGVILGLVFLYGYILMLKVFFAQ